VGDPGAVLEYGVRFSAPVPVPDDDVGTTLTVSGRVEAKLDDRRVSVVLMASANDATVLTKARAVVQLG
jgi:acyl dehydratase